MAKRLMLAYLPTAQCWRLFWGESLYTAQTTEYRGQYHWPTVKAFREWVEESKHHGEEFTLVLTQDTIRPYLYMVTFDIGPNDAHYEYPPEAN